MRREGEVEKGLESQLRHQFLLPFDEPLIETRMAEINGEICHPISAARLRAIQNTHC
jgi:hypothetical protein